MVLFLISTPILISSTSSPGPGLNFFPAPAPSIPRSQSKSPAGHQREPPHPIFVNGAPKFFFLIVFILYSLRERESEQAGGGADRERERTLSSIRAQCGVRCQLDLTILRLRHLPDLPPRRL